MSQLAQLFNEYGESHQHATNKAIHNVAVPLIYWSITGLLFCVSLPIGGLTMAHAVLPFILAWYFKHSFRLGIAMLLMSLLCLFTAALLQAVTGQLLVISVIVFVLAWIGQFYGHKLEGEKPSFFRDIFFLLVGPAWVLYPLLKKLGFDPLA